jgi:hypothetical protein
MQEADLLYSGLIVAAVILSIWTGALITAACFFFAPKLFDAHTKSNRNPQALNV